MPRPFRLYTDFVEPVVRLSPYAPLDEHPDAIVAQRPRGSRRPHTDALVARVRHYIEQTTLTYGEIATKTGVGRASICRWTRDHGWKRPLFAPRATDTVPSPRASQKLKLRKLAERLRDLAERHVRELEQAAPVDPDKLMQALQLLKMARLEAMGRRRPRWIVGRPMTGREWMTRQLHRCGVDADKAPKEAVELVIDAKLPVDDHPALYPRKRRGRR
jgi:sirohydrochlorin ferrochelatase